jgi:hypothetical protein
MSLAQKLHFGSKRQRAAAKLAMAKKRNPAKRRKRTSATRRHRRNPALVVTLGAVNPRRKAMAKRKRKNSRRRTVAAPRRRHTRRRRHVMAVANPRRRRYTRRRRHNPRRAAHYTRRRHTRRRNPIAIFGSSSSKDILSMVGGGLVGVAAAKLIPRTIGSTLSGITSGMGQYGGLVLTGLSAVIAGWAAGKFVSPTFGSAVMFGGLMQTGSVALNLFLPGFAVGGVPVALSGMGDLVPGQFVVPQNPLRLPPAPASPTPRVNMNGLSRVYGAAL